MIKLVKPSMELESKFFNMVNDYIINDLDTLDRDYFRDDFNFIKYIENIEELSKSIGLDNGIIPKSEWWVINQDGDIIGTVRLRHKLEGEIDKDEHGHIGYDIAPRFRRKGFGKEILKLVLQKAKEFNMNKVLITCDEDNIGSIKIIESNNGVFESEIISSELVFRYWIEI